MAWHLTADLDEFLATAGEFLRSRLTENTVLLTVTETLRTRGSNAYGAAAPRFGWWRPGTGPVAGALVHTPPFQVLLTDLPALAVAPLAETLATLAGSVSGVNANRGVAEAFATAWRQATGAPAEVLERLRLYRLGELAPPQPPPPGTARVVGPADRDLLLAWNDAFHAETGGASGDLEGLVDDRIGYGGFTLWEVDGTPVSMAGLTRPIAGMVRVAPVYTPPEPRGRGYASAVTAAVSQAGLDAGADRVLLFTDLANPISNGIYQRLGYRPVEDRVVLGFG